MDLAHLKDWTGRETAQDDIVTEGLVARFRATLGGLAAPAVDDLAPPLLHFCLAPLVVPAEELGSDGHPARGGFLPPVPLPRRMWASGAVTFRGPLRIGDRVRRLSRIVAVTAKTGASGPLCFVEVEHELTVDGRPVITEQQQIVYREAATPAQIKAPQPAPAPPASQWSANITPDPTLLFRYSALTFNAHRIHYDLPYARDVEFYPGLVVQGPLQATLLIHFATRLQGSMPVRFSFRGRAPLFAPAPAVIDADATADGMRLRTGNAQGVVAMEAEAGW